MPPEARRVLIVAPMRSELRPLVRLARAGRREVDGVAVHRGDRPGAELLLAGLGIGPDRARQRAASLLEALRPDRVVVCGVAGALGDGVAVGTVVAADAVVDLDSGRRYQATVSTQPEGTVRATIGTTARLVTDSERLEGFAAQGVLAIDMETAAVAEVCTSAGTPWSAYRGISDQAGDGTVDPSLLGLLDGEGRIKTAAAARLVLTRPGRLAPLVRLGRHSSLAAAGAARAALVVD